MYKSPLPTKLNRSNWFRLICWTILLTFVTNTIGIDVLRVQTANAQSTMLTPPGTLLSASPTFSLPVLTAISLDPIDPFKINFIADAGNELEVKEDQAKLLTQYFLTFLTMPEKDLWVNLSPNESNRIITPELEATTVGRDMLVEDYLLKQLAASMTYPEHETGKIFWEQVMEKFRRNMGWLISP